MKRNIEKEMILYCLQKPPKWETFEKAMVDMYIRMFDKYFKDIQHIPQENIFEVRYEDLIKNPLNEIQKIYSSLQIKGYEKNKEIFEKYIKSQQKIKTYSYTIEDKTKEKIYNYLKDTIDMWGYSI